MVPDPRPTVLSLCAGIGAMDLGLELAIGARTICYVEREGYCQAVLLERMAEEALDPAPILPTLEGLDGRRWLGVVDIVCAGFPCQPYSEGRGMSDCEECGYWFGDPSPPVCPGCEEVALKARISELTARVEELKTEAANIARGCLDYNGGYVHDGDEEQHAAFHHGITTVVNALEAWGKDPNDRQVAVCRSVGEALNPSQVESHE